MIAKLAFTEQQYDLLRKHLYPGDKNEAVALAICGRRSGDVIHRFCVRQIVPIPHDECLVRSPAIIRWPTDRLIKILGEVSRTNGAILKIHSHPGDLRRFSETDDESDRELFTSVSSWLDNNFPHASAIMLPDGSIMGRVVQESRFIPLNVVTVGGNDLRFWHYEKEGGMDGFAERTAQAFGVGTYRKLRQLSVAVAGCSGTGSIVVEQLARLGIGELVLVDPDVVEERNLNRILNAMRDDVVSGRPKVAVLARAVERMGLGTKLRLFQETLFSRKVVEAVAECDVLFGCMDSVDGRWLLNRISTYYSIPYFDVGVKLIANGNGGVEHVGGAVHYLQPGGSSLASRGVFSLDEVRAAGLRRFDPEAYQEQVESKYIERATENQPAVISVNMFFAAHAVNEFLARVHPFKDDANDEFASQRISLSAGVAMNERDGIPCRLLAPHVGEADVEPPLREVELG